MKIRVPDYFKEFKCIAADCEDTCCAGWGIVIDEEAKAKYKDVDGKIGERLKNEIVIDEDGDSVFLLKGDDCSFLNKNKMCDIYGELGEEYLCTTCREFPRYTENFLDLREIGISLSCPEAARIILRDSKTSGFELSEVSEDANLSNDINEVLLGELFKAREIVIDILEDSNLDLSCRSSIVLVLVNEIQEKIDAGKVSEINSVLKKYSDNSFREDIISKLEAYKDNVNIKYTNMHKYLNVFKELEHINSNDPLGLELARRCFFEEDNLDFYLKKHKEFDKYYKENMYKFKNILVYFVFRYFMKAIFDYDVSAKIKTAIISTLMIKELSIVRWVNIGELTDCDIEDIAHMYSKDIEHSELNIEALAEMFETENVFRIDQMLLVLMN